MLLKDHVDEKGENEMRSSSLENGHANGGENRTAERGREAD